MFTGIVEELGTVVAVEHRDASAVFEFSGSLVTDGARPGESICVNGVCLTVVEPGEGSFTTDVMAQTLDLTNIGSLAVGDRVNLERAMAADGRFGGHVVQGHIDGITRVRAIQRSADWTVMSVDLPSALARYIVPQGSIILDGISLTVSAVLDTTFEVSLIPTTLGLTTLGHKGIGDTVNIEVDVLAKYVERILTYRDQELANA
ncbi:riboflavin synthase [Demetria terragena]|uniref:riboflavin synthase n=1 Tax=Demetria terragena TaxID=63959 RepID=UPI00036935C3|nr:riboflavin synthase [Demetria terragena]